VARSPPDPTQRRRQRRGARAAAGTRSDFANGIRAFIGEIGGWRGSHGVLRRAISDSCLAKPVSQDRRHLRFSGEAPLTLVIGANAVSTADHWAGVPTAKLRYNNGQASTGV
jgi:hypothetical protein